MSWISKRVYTVILVVVVTGIVIGSSRRSAAQTSKFVSEADVISGTVTHLVLGPLPTIVNIPPVDQSTTATAGSNEVTGTDVSQTLFGVEVYKIENVDDVTEDDDTATLDDGIGKAKTGKGSLLGDLVTWTSNDDPLTCSFDPTIPNPQVGCTSTETTHGLKINGVAIPAGAYPGGSTFPVSGTLSGDGSSCPSGVGVETFTGYLSLQESTIGRNATTGKFSVAVTGIHLFGQSVCIVNSAQVLYTNSWDLKVAGPEIETNELGTESKNPADVTIQEM